MAEAPQPKVMHVITGLDVGGAETALANLLLSDQPVHRDALAVSLLPGGALRAGLVAAGRRVVDLGMHRGRPSLTALARLARLIRAERPAVVQGWMYHGDLAAGLGLLLSGRRSDARLYWGIRCSDMEAGRYGLGLRCTIAAARALSPMADAAIANSFAGRAEHRRIGYRPRRFGVITNGIDLARFAPDPAARQAVRAELGLGANVLVAACIARVDLMKDHATLLAAAARAPGLTLMLAGAGTERLLPAPGVIALGLRRDVPRLLAAADLIVLPSAFGEGFSNALAEGMAAGLAPIATDVGDAAGIVGATGWIVPRRSVDALAAALQAAMAESPTRRAERGAAARARIEAHFSLDRAVAAFAALYRHGRVPEAD
ncbi:MAG: glycosyltransferase [Alphaproteobacteria bacterium]|nr:glycosyltransferase [Alphaproteobacteria bacterium]